MVKTQGIQMGVVKRQGIKHSIVTYTSVAIGMINILFVYTYAFSSEEIGIIRYLVMASTLFVPLAMMGMSVVSIKFFPEFKDSRNGHNGLLGMISLVSLGGFLVFVLLSLWTGGGIMDLLGRKSELFAEYLPYILFLTFFLMSSNLATSYISNFQRIVVPAIFNDLWIKVALPVLALAYAGGFLRFGQVVAGLAFSYFIASLSLWIYIWHLGQLHLRIHLRFFTPDRVRRIKSYGFFGLLGGLGVTITSSIDIIMVGSLIDLKSAGVYTIAMYISSIIEVPKRSMLNITSPLISKHWNDNNEAEIHTIYKKTSLILLAVGLLLFTCIWASVDQLFSIMPNGGDYLAGKHIILILGIAKIVDLATSVNSNIIGYSSQYRFNLYTALFLGGLNVCFNLYLIPMFGITGVALATLSSIFLINAIKCWFVYYKFRMQPFTAESLKVLGIAAAAYGASCILPSSGYPLPDILLQSLTAGIVYLGLMYAGNISEDFNALLRKPIRKARAYLLRQKD